MNLNQDRIHQTWEKIANQLNLEPLPLPPIHPFETLESTNQTLWQLLREGAPTGTVAIASRQTSGRGQWGRSWSSGDGGLYLSWAIAPKLPTEKAILLTISSAWGIATLLRQYHQPDNSETQLPIQIKWPNDLILNQRKVGGILTETRVHQNQIHQAVVGVGINWENPVPEPGISLKEGFNERSVASDLTCLEDLLALTLRGLISGYEAIDRKKGATLISAYNQLLTHIGQPITIQGQNGKIQGITETGQLCIDLNSSQVLFNPGEIQLGYKNSYRS
ncbi:MAG: biotin--[acetyl-CoA-carboxylase] ligase [Roseofilum sp. SBFL]|uniref:biotin--[acetyl-CoA-carboxylase] ligase n=1 Tax=unclassified Roseofilum TaxID=2620099 RepID=UPI001B030DB6|nr:MULTISPECIES: biotin--[acetyl-CoA-carboxylase] ligase [unclassified Roseofilum]MBP0012022.1 biotin--[acetyl-CoA-carboxylase] ligase [Roseofilum sp. SID3]MBP0026141.1 biotin--[acetyl-CoA-carboxylase] ligase [Roseofilum sp. SID2]MBP0036891.1 biotin--[acetyl-CoA-carboxylase] ligase [Roseofilum sp. SID1]MBP0044207.1 biotin--[acetyl-CoA-carboxylase] ligase [Roseofilum sp. SBFL]